MALRRKKCRCTNTISLIRIYPRVMRDYAWACIETQQALGTDIGVKRLCARCDAARCMPIIRASYFLARNTEDVKYARQSSNVYSRIFLPLTFVVSGACRLFLYNIFDIPENEMSKCQNNLRQVILS